MRSDLCWSPASKNWRIVGPIHPFNLDVQNGSQTGTLGGSSGAWFLLSREMTIGIDPSLSVCLSLDYSRQMELGPSFVK